MQSGESSFKCAFLTDASKLFPLVSSVFLISTQQTADGNDTKRNWQMGALFRIMPLVLMSCREKRL